MKLYKIRVWQIAVALVTCLVSYVMPQVQQPRSANALSAFSVELELVELLSSPAATATMADLQMLMADESFAALQTALADQLLNRAEELNPATPSAAVVALLEGFLPQLDASSESSNAVARWDEFTNSTEYRSFTSDVLDLLADPLAASAFDQLALNTGSASLATSGPLNCVIALLELAAAIAGLPAVIAACGGDPWCIVAARLAIEALIWQAAKACGGFDKPPPPELPPSDKPGPAIDPKYQEADYWTCRADYKITVSKKPFPQTLAIEWGDGAVSQHAIAASSWAGDVIEVVDATHVFVPDLVNSYLQKVYIVGSPENAGFSYTKHSTSQYETQVSGTYPVISPAYQSVRAGEPASWTVIVGQNPDSDRYIRFLADSNFMDQVQLGLVPRGTGVMQLTFTHTFSAAQELLPYRYQHAAFDDSYTDNPTGAHPDGILYGGGNSVTEVTS